MAHILVVDDYIVTQRLLGQILRNGGHSVEIAGDGIQALEILANETFDMVVLDVSMPEMDGIEVLQNIRGEDNPYGDPFVVMLTASSDDRVRVQAEEEGADAFLTKPSSSAQVISTVDGLLASRA